MFLEIITNVDEFRRSNLTSPKIGRSGKGKKTLTSSVTGHSRTYSPLTARKMGSGYENGDWVENLENLNFLSEAAFLDSETREYNNCKFPPFMRNITKLCRTKHPSWRNTAFLSIRQPFLPYANGFYKDSFRKSNIFSFHS